MKKSFQTAPEPAIDLSVLREVLELVGTILAAIPGEVWAGLIVMIGILFGFWMLSLAMQDVQGMMTGAAAAAGAAR